MIHIHTISGNVDLSDDGSIAIVGAHFMWKNFHVEYLSAADFDAVRESGEDLVLGTTYYLQITPDKARLSRLIDCGPDADAAEEAYRFVCNAIDKGQRAGLDEIIADLTQLVDEYGISNYALVPHEIAFQVKKYLFPFHELGN